MFEKNRRLNKSLLFHTINTHSTLYNTSCPPEPKICFVFRKYNCKKLYLSYLRNSNNNKLIIPCYIIQCNPIKKQQKSLFSLAEKNTCVLATWVLVLKKN